MICNIVNVRYIVFLKRGKIVMYANITPSLARMSTKEEAISRPNKARLRRSTHNEYGSHDNISART